MKLQRVRYGELSAKQREIYNFQKLAGVLADSLRTDTEKFSTSRYDTS